MAGPGAAEAGAGGATLQSTLPRSAAFLACGDAFKVALAALRCYGALRRGDLWRFPSLHLDGAKGYNPEGVFGAVVTEELLTLCIVGMGVQIFKRLPGRRFDALERATFVECLFECGGAEAVAGLLAAHRLRALALHGCFVAEADLDRLAPTMGTVRHLSITEAALAVHLAPALQRLLSSTHLESLALSGRFELGTGFAAALGGHAPLAALSLCNNALLKDAVVVRLCEALRERASPCRLTSVDLSAAAGGGRLTDEAAVALGALLSGGAGVARLALAGHRMTKAGLAALLLGGGRLETLDFSANDLGDDALDADLSAAAAAAPRLLRLHVGGGGGDEFGSAAGGGEGSDSDGEGRGGPDRRHLATLAWAAPTLRTLVVLDASGAALDDPAVSAFATGMASMSQVALRELLLARNFITEDGVSALLVGLQRGRASLRRLDLGINQVGDDGCRAVAQALRQSEGEPLASLERLSLRANAIARLPDLCRALRSCRLAELDVRENLLSEDDARQLVAACKVRERPIRIALAGNELDPELDEELGLSEEQEFVYVPAAAPEVPPPPLVPPAPSAAGEAPASSGGRVFAPPPRQTASPAATERPPPPPEEAGAEAPAAAAPRPPEHERPEATASPAAGAAAGAAAAAWAPSSDAPPPSRVDARGFGRGDEGTAGPADQLEAGDPLFSDLAARQAEDLEGGPGGEPRPMSMLSREEWQECLDTLEFMQSCLKP